MNDRPRPLVRTAGRPWLRCVLVGALSAGLCGISPAPASARPWPIDAPATEGHLRRPVERIGLQFVAGDNLTGAGVRAPSWVPIAG